MVVPLRYEVAGKGVFKRLALVGSTSREEARILDGKGTGEKMNGKDDAGEEEKEQKTEETKKKMDVVGTWLAQLKSAENQQNEVINNKSNTKKENAPETRGKFTVKKFPRL